MNNVDHDRVRPTMVGRRRPAVLATVFATVAAAAGIGLVAATPASAAPLPAPTIANVSPNAGPTSGGNNIEVSGTGFTGVANVMVGGVSATRWGYSTAYLLTVVAPRHAAGRVNIRIVTDHGTTAVVGNRARYSYVTAPRALRVGAPRTIDPHGTLSVISCPNAGFCAAFDDSGNAVMFDHGAWHARVKLAGESGGVGSVSCASAVFCVATDGDGHSFRWTGSDWQRIGTFSRHVQWAVSCVDARFCMAVNDHADAIRYNGTAWVDEVDGMDSQDYLHLTSVSCASRTMCYAAGNEEQEYAAVLAYRNGVWDAQAQPFASGGPLGATSCPQAHFCAVGTDNGASVWTGDTYHGHNNPFGWSDEIAFHDAGTANGSITSLDCSNATFCMAYWQDNVRGIKHWVRFDGASWTPQPFTVQHPGSFPTAVSCWSRYDCQFVGGTDTYRSS